MVGLMWKNWWKIVVKIKRVNLKIVKKLNNKMKIVCLIRIMKIFK